MTVVNEHLDVAIPVIASEVEIQPVSFRAILDDPAAPALLRAYAEECLVPDAEPQIAIYESMEKANVIQCFAAYYDRPGTPLLIGFVSILRTIVPHDGHHIAAIESLFVDPAYRSTGAFLMLAAAAEQFATVSGCRCLLASARIGSALDVVLSRRTGYEKTHNQHTRWLNGFKGGRA
jgi:GNAT superfamily N-acetyltransferase